MNEEYGIREIISQYQKEICYYSQMEAFGTTPYEKKYHQNLIKERTEDLIRTMEHYILPPFSPEQKPEIVQTPQGNTQPSAGNQSSQRVFTLEELKAFNGEGDNPAYVAVNGTVYDVSSRIPWAGGTHFGLYAGNDLTDDFMICHSGLTTILEQLPVVGVLITD